MTAKKRRTGRLESAWYELGGLRLHARVSVTPAPPGLPVVLVHGLGVSSRYLVPTAELLARQYRVYAPDLPGYGKSEKPRQVLGVAAQADALAAWLRVAGIKRAMLLGNSLGCQIIVDLAARYPEYVARAVLLGPTMDSRARTTVQQVWRLLRDVPREPLSQPFLVIYDYARFGLLRAWRTFQDALRDPVEAKLPLVRAPVLVVRGERDPIAPQSWTEQMTRLLPDGRLAVIPGSGHTANYGAPEKLVRVVEPFLRAEAECGMTRGSRSPTA